MSRTRTNRGLPKAEKFAVSLALTKRLERRLRFYRIAVILLATVLVVVVPLYVYTYIENHTDDIRLFASNSEIPYFDETREIMQALQFSFLPTLMRPDVHISVDFENKTWTIHNIRKFDGQGRFMLEQGRYGRCGELSYHVYQEIVPLLRDKYTIELWRSAESKFFPFMIGDHTVLRITDKGLLASNVFIIDPTYNRYGRLEDFDSYIFIKPHDLMPFAERETDETFKVGTTTPVLLTKRYLLSLGVIRVNDSFDSQNFGLAVILSRPHRYISRAVAEVRKNRGETETGDAAQPAKAIKTKEYYALHKKMIEFFEQISGEPFPEQFKAIQIFTQTSPASR